MRRILILVFMLLCVSCSASANESSVRSSVVGVDFNFVSALLTADSGQPHIAGTLTYAKKERNWELAFPFFYTQFTNDPAICCEVHIKRVDVQLRRYFRKNQLGPYIGLLVRHSDLLGRNRNNFNERISFSRTGIGTVVGVRALLYKNLYWGSNLHVGTFLNEGRLLADGTDAFFSFGPSEVDSSELFFNIELLKVGLRF